MAGWVASMAMQRIYIEYDKDDLVALGLPKVGGIGVRESDVDIFRGLAGFVKEHVPARERIYIGLNRHDALLISKPWLYFLFDRLPATRYHELHPGIVDTLDVQNEMIRDINEQGVNLVVLWKPFNVKAMDKWKGELAANLPKVGATVLDEYLASNFTKVAQFGREISGYSVLLRNPVSTGAGR
jgi:hypothetical protein